MEEFLDLEDVLRGVVGVVADRAEEEEVVAADAGAEALEVLADRLTVIADDPAELALGKVHDLAVADSRAKRWKKESLGLVILTMRAKSICLAMSVVGAVMSVPAAADDYEKARQAYNRMDYKTAFKIASPLAKKGDPRAQDLLGHMYNWGRGVEQDRCTAAVLFDRAARQGYVPAYKGMAFVYTIGLGVPSNLKLAYRWKLAAVREGDKAVEKDLDLTEAGLWPGEIKRIRASMKTWFPKKQPPIKVRRLPNNLYGRVVSYFTNIHLCRD